MSAAAEPVRAVKPATPSLRLLQRISFPQLLLVAFLLVAGVLAAASLHGLYALEKLLAQSREGNERTVADTSTAQMVAEDSVNMERAARQYLVLDDPAVRERFATAARNASRALDSLSRDDLPPALAGRWHATLGQINDELAGPRDTTRDRDLALTADFRQLASLNNEVAQHLRLAAQARNRALRDELEAGRQQLAREIVGGIALAVLLAVGFGVWLARPLKRLEGVIAGLGENRLDLPVEIRGPSDVRRLGRRLDGLRIRLAELDADKARFLRHVSHELKTPLAALREGVSLLEEGVTGALNPSQREVAGILRQNTDVLQARIEDLLRFNTAAFEARRLVRRRVPLRELVARLVDEQRLQWQARQLRIDVHGDGIEVEADPDKLGTALGNLLSNAIRFSPVGATIAIHLSARDGRACIEIADEGPGVAPGDQARVFEPFYRGVRQPDDAVRGTGIGLSIVHEYVAAHGGQVQLLPEGPGARFRIELPHAFSH